MERQSIVQEDMNQCFVCGSTFNLETHHLIGGPNRKHSDKYKLVVRLCREHHTGSSGVHFNKPMMMAFHELAQRTFEKEHSHEEWMQIFGKNFI